MAKYTDEVKKQVVEAVSNGTPIREITEKLGPNAKAIARYCKAVGVELPKQPRKARVKKAKTDETDDTEEVKDE